VIVFYFKVLFKQIIVMQYTNQELCDILKSDWTNGYVETDSQHLQSSNFMESFDLFTNAGSYPLFFKEFLVNRNGCMSPTQELDECIARLKPRDYRIDIDTDRIIERLNYFESKGCLALKICFGLNKSLIEKGQLQLIISGSFCDTGNPNTTVDNHYRNAKNEIEYYLNFTNQKLSKTKFNQFHSLLDAEITNDDENVIWGYILSIKTFKSILIKSEYLGTAKKIRIEFGMNKFSTSLDTTRTQILMLKFSAAKLESSYRMWLFDRNFVPCDTLDCPPRMGCQ
jgi:hypothetical protein